MFPRRSRPSGGFSPKRRRRLLSEAVARQDLFPDFVGLADDREVALGSAVVRELEAPLVAVIDDLAAEFRGVGAEALERELPVEDGGAREVDDRVRDPWTVDG